MGEHSTDVLNQPTQSAYPWRATVRTVFQVAVALAALVPIVVVAGGIPATGAVAVVLSVCAAVTRVMANPVVNEFLRLYVPWLAAEPQR